MTVIETQLLAYQSSNFQNYVIIVLYVKQLVIL